MIFQFVNDEDGNILVTDWGDEEDDWEDEEYDDDDFALDNDGEYYKKVEDGEMFTEDEFKKGVITIERADGKESVFSPSIPYIGKFFSEGREGKMIRNYCAWYDFRGKDIGRNHKGNYSCHGSMLGWMKYGFKNFTTLTYVSDDLSKDWYDWILGPESPWRKVAPPSSYQRVYKDGNLIAIDFLTDEYALAEPGLFYNFLIATRQPYDGYGAAQAWYKILKNAPDFDKSDAYVLGHIFGNSTYSFDNNVLNYHNGSITNGWHTPLAHRNKKLSPNPRRLKEADCVPGVSENHSNDVWNDNEGVGRNVTANKFFKAFEKAESFTVQGGAFKKDVDAYSGFSVTVDDAIDCYLKMMKEDKND